jgi:ferrochelatase
MPQSKTGVLLVNLGTPDSPKVPDVRKYLREFLMDPRVVDYPAALRWPLVNLIIAPFRAPKSAAEYRKLWTENGSPLLYFGQESRRLLAERLPEKEYVVELAMRYQSPSIAEGLRKLQKAKVERLLVIPLFPQYASATTGSVAQKVMELIQEWPVIPSLEIVEQFHQHPLYLKAWAEQGKALLDAGDYEHVVFSYHGVPESQIKTASVEGYCRLGDCCNSYHNKNRFCYRAQCFENSRNIAGIMGLKAEDYTVCFQSRLGPVPWIRPYADDVVKQLGDQGYKRVLAFSPAFVADCLETTLEVGEEYKELFEEHGGEQWDLVPSLNARAPWIDCLEDIVRHSGRVRSIGREGLPEVRSSQVAAE